jgi:hypothetical protein
MTSRHPEFGENPGNALAPKNCMDASLQISIFLVGLALLVAILGLGMR